MGEKEVEYTPATFLQTTFQDLLKMCISVDLKQDFEAK